MPSLVSKSPIPGLEFFPTESIQGLGAVKKKGCGFGDGTFVLTLFDGMLTAGNGSPFVYRTPTAGA